MANKAPKYRVIGLKEPGIVNVLLDGRFQNVHLHDADDIVLEKLFKDGCPYIQKTPETMVSEGSSKIEVKPVTQKTKFKNR